MLMIDTIFFLIFPVMVIAAAIYDLLTMKIPNAIPSILAIAFLGLAFIAGVSWEIFGWHILMGGIALFLGFTLFSLGWMGGGDAKFLASIALWLDWETAIAFITLTAIFGGMLTLALLALRYLPLPPVFFRQKWSATLLDKKTGIPYGIAIALGGIWVYPDTLFYVRFLPNIL